MPIAILFILSVLLGQTPVTPPPPPTASTPTSNSKSPELVALEGCVTGTVLKSVAGNRDDISLPASDSYQMTGSREIRAQIKAANAAQVRVTGRVSYAPDGAPRGKKFGKATVTVGQHDAGVPASQTRSATPPIPVIEVHSLSTIDARCQ